MPINIFFAEMGKLKKIIILGFFIIVFTISSCSTKTFNQIQESDISEISIWKESEEPNNNLASTKLLFNDEKSKFVTLYNNSQYEGKATGEGGTPYFGAKVIFKDNSELVINQFDDKGKFEVFYFKKQAYYLENQHLYDFLNDITADL